MNGLNAYRDSASARASEAQLLQHAPLVKRIAYHLLSRLPPNVLLEDLVQVGMLGLLEAFRNYDADQGASFETYAGIRIRGAMLDEIRRSDWTPRSVHRKSREVAEAIRKVENAKGRDAKDSEIAAELDISLDEYHQILQDSVGSRVLSIDEMEDLGITAPKSLTEGGSGPIDGLEREGFKRALVEAIANLPERERLVVSLYYDDELNLREIGEVLGVTESRVCQIHSQATSRLRAKLADWLSDSGSAHYARATY
ncbi:MAG: RNA polymerase sigma factor FliA [Gammaproteobacteria bacterium]|nr:RNA polymerase sigma factor FliA [Gammaproteobacteria bacterium]